MTNEMKPGERVMILASLGSNRLTGIWGTVTHCESVSPRPSGKMINQVFAKWDLWTPDQSPSYVPREHVCTSFLGHAGTPCVFCDYCEGDV